MPLNELRLPLSLNTTKSEAERHYITKVFSYRFLKSSP
ncbi:hypothetical protein T4B_1729 [Trichinella pseudospiralis]|uniref:Uncharacterized protein n=1 Tax=Trichinella pseudospiralis TaxID=6337 RepID=A0A0V1GA25_TRIPS|nr:hypothetical protein T4B_1729 [Trichinella pseudospiralis]